MTQPDPQRLTVVVQPMALKETENPALSVPLSVTATPEQLDAELPAALRGFAGEHVSIAGALADATRRMKDAATAKDGAKPGGGGPARPAAPPRVAAPPPPPPVPTLWDPPAQPPAPAAEAGGEPPAAEPDAAHDAPGAEPDHEAAQAEDEEDVGVLQEVA